MINQIMKHVIQKTLINVRIHILIKTTHNKTNKKIKYNIILKNYQQTNNAFQKRIMKVKYLSLIIMIIYNHTYYVIINNLMIYSIYKIKNLMNNKKIIHFLN